MIRIKRVPAISAKVAMDFVDHSKQEWKQAKKIRGVLYQKSAAIWVLYLGSKPLCVIGLIELSLIGSGCEVYFFLCHAAQKHLRILIAFLRRAFRRAVNLYGMITVSIDTAHKAGERFVRFFGFKECPGDFVALGITCKHFELRKSWLL